MKISHIAVGKTFNIGNYQSLRIEMAAEVEAVDTVERVTLKLNKMVHEARNRLDSDYATACVIVNSPEKYSRPDIVKAQAVIDKYKGE